jgi:hypothetical protein
MDDLAVIQIDAVEHIYEIVSTAQAVAEQEPAQP